MRNVEVAIEAVQNYLESNVVHLGRGENDQ
jgi:hypothetical protein